MKEQKMEELQVEFAQNIYNYLNQICETKQEASVKGIFVIQATRNLARGCNWAIVPKSDMNAIQVLAKNYKTMQKIDNFDIWSIQDDHGKNPAYLIEVNEDLLCQIMDNTAPKELWSDYIKEQGHLNRLSALESCSSYLKNLRENNVKDSIVCIYNTNLKQQVCVSNNVYAAFSVNIEEFLMLCDKWGFYIVLKDCGDPKYDNMRVAPKSLLREDKKSLKNWFMESLRYTPGGNALQIQISLDKPTAKKTNKKEQKVK